MTKQRQRGARNSNSVDSPRYRRSPFLISYWLGPVHVLENYVTRQKVEGNSFANDLIAFFDEPHTFRELYAKFPGEEPSILQDAVRCLQKHSFLERSVDQGRRLTDPWSGWESWSPAASHFHFSTKDVSYSMGDAEDFSSLRKLAKRKRFSPRRKKYPNKKFVQLSKSAGKGEFERVLKARRTWREFSDQPLDLSKLATLLQLSFGIHGWIKIPGFGRLPLKTSPSGGALHPLEAYLLIRNVTDIVPGIYHHDEERHRLELLRAGTSRMEVKKLLAGQGWFSAAAFVVFLTAVFPRTQWKYEHSRAYRVVLAEAGHVCQTFCLAATWLGLAPFCTMALADTKIERALGLDGFSESVVYAMGAGVRPNRPAIADRLREDSGKRW
jgi:SagB-type dehydrogenase family enzyme